jgi:hypothetical protein
VSIAFVQANLGGTATQIVSSGSLFAATGNFGTTTQSGSLLVLVGNCTESAALSSNMSGGSTLHLPTTSGITWVNAGVGLGFATGAGTFKFNSALWYVANAPSVSSATTVNFSATGSANGTGSVTEKLEFYLLEFSGVSATIDTKHNNSGNAGVIDPGTLTTTASDLILAFFASDGNNLTAGSGYSLGATFSVATTCQLQYQVNSSIGSVPTAFTGSGTQTIWGSGAIAFKASAPSSSGNNSYGFYFG